MRFVDVTSPKVPNLVFPWSEELDRAAQAAITASVIDAPLQGYTIRAAVGAIIMAEIIAVPVRVLPVDWLTEERERLTNDLLMALPDTRSRSQPVSDRERLRLAFAG